MKNTFVICLVFAAGISIGWYLTRQHTPSLIEAGRESSERASKPDVNLSQESQVDAFDVQLLFFKTMSQSGFRMGEAFESVRAQLIDEHKEALDKQLLDYADLLFGRRSEDKKTHEKLLALLGNITTDKTVMEKLATVFAENGLFERAVDYLAEAKRLAQYAQDIASIENKISAVVEQNIQGLKKNKQSAAQESFYKYLLDKFPGEYRFQWQYANFAYEEKKYEHAGYLLEELRYLPEYSAKANLLLEKINFHANNKSAASSVVSLAKQGESYFVKAVINETEPVNLLIDTGASITMISPGVAYSLGLMDIEPEKLVTFQTANGEVVAPVVRLESMRVGDYVLQDIQVGILQIAADGQIHGLLGMNFLKQFRFFIDQQGATLELNILP